MSGFFFLKLKDVLDLWQTHGVCTRVFVPTFRGTVETTTTLIANKYLERRRKKSQTEEAQKKYDRLSASRVLIYSGIK